jgi:hypothetical protein
MDGGAVEGEVWMDGWEVSWQELAHWSEMLEENGRVLMATTTYTWSEMLNV